MRRHLWPILWLVGFRIKDEGERLVVKLPGWLPNKQKFADDVADQLVEDYPDAKKVDIGTGSERDS